MSTSGTFLDGSESAKHAMYPSPPPTGQVQQATDKSSLPTDKCYAVAFFQGEDELVPIKAEVDTGSCATMVTESMYVAHFSHIALKPLSKVLWNFDESPVKGIRGSIALDAYCSGKMQHVWVYITSDIVSPVLGWNLI